MFFLRNKNVLYYCAIKFSDFTLSTVTITTHIFTLSTVFRGLLYSLIIYYSDSNYANIITCL